MLCGNLCISVLCLWNDAMLGKCSYSCYQSNKFQYWIYEKANSTGQKTV